jgi:hypothetical protein
MTREPREHRLGGAAVNGPAGAAVKYGDAPAGPIVLHQGEISPAEIEAGLKGPQPDEVRPNTR